MPDNNRSEFLANLALSNQMPTQKPDWRQASRCKRPPLAKAPTMFERLLTTLGLK